MASERIDGIKYNLGKEPDEVVVGIRDNLLEKHVRLVGDIERITGELALRGLVPTPEREDLYEQLELLGDRPPLERGDLPASGAHPL
jgi:hypothetical protein